MFSDRIPPSIVFLIQGCKELRDIAVKSAATKVDRLTPAEEARMGGRGPCMWPMIKRMVMMNTVALKRAWNPRAIKTGKGGEMRIAVGR